MESYLIREATPADLEGLVDLHYRIFDTESHYAMLFGRRFIRATYRWYCQVPAAFALVGEINGEIKGSCTVNQGSYYAVFKANAGALARAFLTRPGLIFAQPVRSRLAALLKRRSSQQETVRPDADPAYLAYLAVDADARATGLGKGLIQRAIGECNQRGWGDIITAIHRNNLPARFMYRTLGFEDAPELSHDNLVGIRLRHSPKGDAQS